MNGVRVPTRLIDVLTLAGGRRVVLRPVLPQDADLMQRLVTGLSLQARSQRFFAPIRELPAEWLRRMTLVDHSSHVALIAESFDAAGARAVGEARYVASDSATAEFALCVADDWQRLGIGRRLLASLQAHAAGNGLCRLEGEILAENRAMIALARRQRFRVTPHPNDARLMHASCSLDALVVRDPVCVREPLWACATADAAALHAGATSAMSRLERSVSSTDLHIAQAGLR